LIEKEAAKDDALIRAYLKGSEKAFKELLGRHTPNLLAVVERQLGDHHSALDVVQEVFIKLYEILPRYRFQGKFRSMLFAMALNRARDRLRKMKRSKTVNLEDPKIQKLEPSGPNPFERLDQQQAIEQALKQIEPPFHEALYLRDVMGLSYEELARVLHCSLGTVKSRVHRGRLIFRDAYQKLTEINDPPSQGESHAS